MLITSSALHALLAERRTALHLQPFLPANSFFCAYPAFTLLSFSSFDPRSSRVQVAHNARLEKLRQKAAKMDEDIAFLTQSAHAALDQREKVNNHGFQVKTAVASRSALDWKKES
eukprot:4697299-Pleurochrysis_carterae.AAC.1